MISVYNVKRRVAALPPITSDTYQALFAIPTKSDTSSDSDSTPCPTTEYTKRNSEPAISDGAVLIPQQCIFCLEVSSTTRTNIDHMAASHGLVLPDLPQLQTDLETLISYLHLVVADYCECLLCGSTKRSAQAARAHMLAKGHCMLNLSEGSEFLEFWEAETEDKEGPDAPQASHQLLSKTEMRLASGAIVTSREDAHARTQYRARRFPKDEETPKGIPSSSGPSEEPLDDAVVVDTEHRDQKTVQKPGRTLAVRDQMGLTGLSDAERRSFAVSQRQIDLSALRARNKAQWTLEKMGNRVKQKHFVVGSPCRSGWFLDPCMR